MKVAKYWARETAKQLKADGQPVEISCWGWSSEGLEGARESALARAKRVLQAFLSGRELQRYPYGNGMPREELLETFADVRGEPFAAVTRNSSGSLVLGAARVMFIDIDFTGVTIGQTLRYHVARLLGRSAAPPEARGEGDVLAMLDRFGAEHPDWNLHIYRTFGGVRAVATHDLFDPTAEATHEVLRSLGTDPLYCGYVERRSPFEHG